jgi:hypothetical protein
MLTLLLVIGIICIGFGKDNKFNELKLIELIVFPLLSLDERW